MKNSIQVAYGRVRTPKPVRPTVMVGECLFAARGKVSFVKASNPPAANKMIDTVIDQALTGIVDENPESLGIRTAPAKSKQIVYYSTDPINARPYYLRSIVDRNELKRIPSNVSVAEHTLANVAEHFQTLDNFLKKGNTHLVVISAGNESSYLGDTEEEGVEYMDSLVRMAKKYRTTVIVVFNQYRVDKMPKNGPFKEKAENRAFGSLKISYEYLEKFKMESNRAPKNHGFFPINFERFEGETYHRGLKINRTPK